jgi:hypothetical protein
VLFFCVSTCKHCWCKVMWFLSKRQLRRRMRHKYCAKEFYLYLYLNFNLQNTHPWIDNVHHLPSICCVHKNLHSFSVVPKSTYLFNLFNVHGSVHRKNILIYIQKESMLHIYFIWKLLYIFRVVPPPIIRSANNCIYSIWYWSHRYGYLPLQ